MTRQTTVGMVLIAVLGAGCAQVQETSGPSRVMAAPSGGGTFTLLNQDHRAPLGIPNDCASDRPLMRRPNPNSDLTSVVLEANPPSGWTKGYYYTESFRNWPGDSMDDSAAWSLARIDSVYNDSPSGTSTGVPASAFPFARHLRTRFVAFCGGVQSPGGFSDFERWSLGDPGPACLQSKYWPGCVPSGE